LVFGYLFMKIICPICKRKTTREENPWKPFCSERCKLIDLGKWVSEEYRIAGEKAEKEQGTESNEQLKAKSNKHKIESKEK